jgi:hypothetical protein
MFDYGCTQNPCYYKYTQNPCWLHVWPGYWWCLHPDCSVWQRFSSGNGVVLHTDACIHHCNMVEIETHCPLSVFFFRDAKETTHMQARDTIISPIALALRLNIHFRLVLLSLAQRRNTSPPPPLRRVRTSKAKPVGSLCVCACMYHIRNYVCMHVCVYVMCSQKSSTASACT